MHRWLAFGAPEYTLIREQWAPRSMEEVFPFFDDPQNLPRITPPALHFKITGMTPEVIREGTIITYRMKWFGIPYRWKTLIELWEPGEQFVDTQVSGPYILWHHTHTFESCQGGVFMTDRVRYRLPFGPVGVLLHTLIVKRQLNTIFDYRMQKIAEYLSEGKVFRKPPPE
jgi:ligand-binding SRPBCC domain-containing protein